MIRKVDHSFRGLQGPGWKPALNWAAIIGGFSPLDLFLKETFMWNRSAIDSSKSCEPPESNPTASAVTKLTEEPPSPTPAYKPYANEPELPGALYKPYAKKPLPPGPPYEPYKGM